MSSPYFYIIQHINTGKYYAGYKALNPNSKNLLTEHGYKTSSNVILKIIENEGRGVFVVRKIRHFQTKEEAYSYEVRFLKRVNAKMNDRFYNKSNGDAGFHLGSHTEETKRKISIKNKGKVKSKEHREKISKSRTGFVTSDVTKEKISLSMRDRVFTEEHCENLSKAGKGKLHGPMDDATKDKISNALLGREFSEEHRMRLSESGKGRPVSEETRLKQVNAQKGRKLSPERYESYLRGRALIKARKLAGA